MDVTSGISAYPRDINDEKEAQQELHERDELLRNVIEALPIGVWMTDKTGTIQASNAASRRIWEGALYVGPERFGEYRGWWVESDQPIAAHEWAAARAIQKGETSLNELIRIQCFDGQYKVIRNSSVPLRNAQQEITGAIVVNQDVTQHNRNEVAQQVLASVGRRFVECTEEVQIVEQLTQAAVPALGSLALFVPCRECSEPAPRAAIHVSGSEKRTDALDIRATSPDAPAC